MGLNIITEALKNNKILSNNAVNKKK